MIKPKYTVAVSCPPMVNILVIYLDGKTAYMDATKIPSDDAFMIAKLKYEDLGVRVNDIKMRRFSREELLEAAKKGKSWPIQLGLVREWSWIERLRLDGLL